MVCSTLLDYLVYLSYFTISFVIFYGLLRRTKIFASKLLEAIVSGILAFYVIFFIVRSNWNLNEIIGIFSLIIVVTLGSIILFKIKAQIDRSKNV